MFRHVGRRHSHILLVRTFQSSSICLRIQVNPRPKKKSKPPGKASKKESADASKKDKEMLSQHIYYDPSNKSLDFSLLNRDLFQKIQNEAQDRTYKRVKLPAQEWIEQHGANAKDTYEKMLHHLTHGTVSLQDNLSPLSVGDLVLLSNDSTLLQIVVECPQTLDSVTYTFVDSEGEITYGTKHHIKLRIPQVIPKDLLERVQLVTLEKKYSDIAPIGMPDSKFSRSILSLPADLQKIEQKEDETSAGPEFSTSGDSFVVAQATAQLLTDSDVKTFIVPTSARLMYSAFLKTASIRAYNKLTIFMDKLDYLHRVLQFDERNHVVDASRTIPLFELFDIVTKFNPTLEIIRQAIGTNEEYRVVSSVLRGSTDKRSSFGKKIPENTKVDFARAKHHITSYIAFIVALSSSSRKWKINTQASTKTPISVEVLPLLKSIAMKEAFAYLKGEGRDEFVKFYLNFIKTGKVGSQTPHYDTIIQMFKDFIASNITQDGTMESVLGSLIRGIDKALEKENLHTSHCIPYAYEYSRSRALEIVTSLEQNGYTNPMQWSDALKLPNSTTSPEADLQLQYYSLLDKNSRSEILDLKNKDAKSWLKKEFYPMDAVADIRKDFGDIPVYCIDSPTAHEIDDGISIHTKDNQYVFTIHVANPTSYIKPRSTISEIAFSKGSTVYLPEGPSMMLPHIVSEICGLNGTDSTRTFAIQFGVDRDMLDKYFQEPNVLPSPSFTKKMLHLIQHTACVKFFRANNFPKDYTYENVNKVLDNEENIRKFQNGELAEGSHELNLFRLFHVSTMLKHARITIGGGLEMVPERLKVLIEYIKEDVPEDKQFSHVPNGYRLALAKKNYEKSPVITITKDVDQNGTSKSQRLVSEFMIAGNFSGLVYAHKNKVPIIHRTQELSIAQPVREQLHKLNRSLYEDKRQPSVEESAQLLSILNSANYEVTRKRHESLGLESYLTLTSPLRRYVDMVNHWMFEKYERKKAGMDIQDEKDEHNISKKDLDYMANHLQSCEMANRTAQRFSDRFWKGTFLKIYFEKLGRGLINNPIEFSVLLRSDAKFGDVRAEIVGFEEVNTVVVQNEYVINKFASGEFKVGQVIHNACFRVMKLDFLENDCAIELTST